MTTHPATAEALKEILRVTAREWGSNMESLTLTESEIVEATGYKQPVKQLSALKRAGIIADRRPDGSVRVWRHHIAGIGMSKAAPQRHEPKLKSDRKAA